MINLTEERLQHIIRDLIHKNSLYIDTFLSICKIELCDGVGSAKIILNKNPTIQIDKNFVSKNCTTEEHVQSLIVHELLHLVFSYDEEKANDETDLMIKNIAHDAIINAFIHRTLGCEYSSLMSNYYKNCKFPLNILRPPTEEDKEFEFYDFWLAIYEGKLTIDDVKIFLRNCIKFFPLSAAFLFSHLLGDHSGNGNPKKIPGVILKTLNGMKGKLKDNENVKKHIGISNGSKEIKIQIIKKRILKWEQLVFHILSKIFIESDQNKLNYSGLINTTLPVLSPSDNKSIIKSLWNPFIPFSNWELTGTTKQAGAFVYLDASGSMFSELKYLVKVLRQFSNYIKMPFWSFSTEVFKAKFEKGFLSTGTTEGTDMNCVLEHLEKKKPKKALIITDGYTVELKKDLLKKVFSKTKIYVIITPCGSDEIIKRSGIKDIYKLKPLQITR